MPLQLPLTINCWPSVSGSETFVNIEYEASGACDLQSVTIAIPLPPLQNPPRVTQVSALCSRLCLLSCAFAMSWGCLPALKLPRSLPLAFLSWTAADPGRASASTLLEQADGNTRWESRRHVMFWTIDLIDEMNRSGSMEMVLPAEDPDTFFPIQVRAWQG